MSDHDEGGDPACWLHLFEPEPESEVGPGPEAPDRSAADPADLEGGGDPPGHSPGRSTGAP